MILKSPLQTLVFINLLIFLITCPIYAQSVIINEFMASNAGSVLSDDDQSPDWIELYNTSDQTVSLAGMYLSDRLNNLIKWQFPHDRPDLTTLDPNGYQVIWASGSMSTQTELHASFSLSADGEVVVLTAADGQTILDSITFNKQHPDTSFGRDPNYSANWKYLYEPTPGQANSQGFLGWVEPVQFSVERGFYNEPISITLSTNTPDAEIWFTLNADIPHSSFYEGREGHVWNGEKYTVPLSILRTTCIRAIARKDDWHNSDLVTHTYIFLEDVINQATKPVGFPSTWGRAKVDYAMDPRVVNDPAYQDTIKNDLMSIPSINIAIDNDDFFGSTKGIYAHPGSSGPNWERFCTMEWLDPNTDSQFMVNAGLRIHGGVGRSTSVAKHSLRFLFKNKYGPATLEYPLFPDSPVDRFESLVLRATWNYSFIGDSTACGGLGTDHAQYMRDCFTRDTVRDMGRLTPYGRHVHLYINGLYWGVYILTERPDDGFAAHHLGGDPTQYDVLKASNSTSRSQMDIIAGNLDTWNTLFSDLIQKDMSDPEAYQAVADTVNIPALIDYMLMIFYVGSRDAPTLLCNDYIPRNFYTIRRREPGAGFIFVPWDVEWSLEYVTEDRVSRIGGEQNPGLLFRELGDNEQLRQQVADHIHRHFFNEGALSVTQSTDRYVRRSQNLYQAIVGESARWGDALRSSHPYTRDEEWMDEWQRLVNEYIPARSSIVLHQFRAEGWYPSVDAPVFYINEIYQHDGPAEVGDLLSINNPNNAGTIFYTLDGTDPRSVVDPQENEIPLVTEQASKRVLIPSQDMGTQWIDANFNDANWSTTHGNVGFEWGYGYLDIIDFDVLDDMWAKNTSCYMRIAFDVDDPSIFSRLKLKIRYDDGFAAFINGVLVAQENASLPLSWNAHADFAHEAEQDFTEFLITDLESLNLSTGLNILAIHGLNASVNSTDFLISVELAGIEGPSYDDILYTDPINLDHSIHIKSCILQDGQWSALNEAVYIVDPWTSLL